MKLLLILIFVPILAMAMEEETEALRAMRLSCEKQKVGLGCFNYANMLERLNRSSEAERYFNLGCKLKHEPSCSKEKWDIPEKQMTSDSEGASEAVQNDASSEPVEDLNSLTPSDGMDTTGDF